MKKQLAVPLLVALGCVFVDVYGFGLPMTAWILGLAVIVHLAKLAWGRPDESAPKERWQRAAIYGAAVVLIVAGIAGNVRLAARRGARIAAAVKQYRAASGAYPETLEKLVPSYLPDIPRCCIRSPSPRFRYFWTPNRSHPTLFWVAIPPFGKGTYDFEDDRLRPNWD